MASEKILQSELLTLEREVEEKRSKIKQLEDLLRKEKTSRTVNPNRYHEQVGADSSETPGASPERPRHPFLAAEYQRYGRQMILHEIGLSGQRKLKAAKILIVGVGGLGCPAAVYLSGAGVGTLGLVDGDTVETSNLHRQILHRTNGVGTFKVDSAVETLKQLNPHVSYIPIRENLTPSLAAAIFPVYDLILDCTDRPSTRYLVSDAAVLAGKPLVTASAVKTEGQLVVLNNPPTPPGDKNGSPCYRCIFPKPPPPESVTSCADGGILGPVVGTMGVLQALEAIKVLTTAQSVPSDEPQKTSMLIFSAYGSTQFRNIFFRRRKPKCRVCGSNPEITLSMFRDDSLDYASFCGVMSPLNLLRPEERISAEEYQAVRTKPHILIDTREKTQFDICHLEGSINVPIEEFRATVGSNQQDTPPPWLSEAQPGNPVYMICRLGNDSQEAVKMLKSQSGEGFPILDIRGGLRAWRETVDPQFPDY